MTPFLFVPSQAYIFIFYSAAVRLDQTERFTEDLKFFGENPNQNDNTAIQVRNSSV